MNTKFLSTAIILLTAFTGMDTAYGKGQPSPYQREVKSCNHDARMAAEKLTTQFKTADSNGNNLLEQNEATAVQIAARCFRHLDRNKDGVLSTAELQRMS
jgi:hypothetical protein